MARPTCGWGWVVGQITIRIRRRLPRPHTLTASLETRNWAMAARVGRPGLKYGRAFHRPGMRGASTTSVPSRGAFLPRKTQKGTKSFFDRITGLTRFTIVGSEVLAAVSVSSVRSVANPRPSLCLCASVWEEKQSWRTWRAWRETFSRKDRKDRQAFLTGFRTGEGAVPPAPSRTAWQPSLPVP